MFRAHDDENGEWYTTCGDECLFKIAKNGDSARWMNKIGQMKDERIDRNKKMIPTRISGQLWGQLLEERKDRTRLKTLASGSVSKKKEYFGLRPDEVWKKKNQLSLEVSSPS